MIRLPNVGITPPDDNTFTKYRLTAVMGGLHFTTSWRFKIARMKGKKKGLSPLFDLQD